MERAEFAVVRLLQARNWRITFAESCTGGLAAGRLVDVPDASRVFDGSFVTYANEAKIKWLGVGRDLIEAHGVVSEPVALAMADGAAERAGTQVAVGISGIAGPSGGSREKPVGTVCFGFAVEDRHESFTMHFGNIGRSAVREKSVAFVFETLQRMLEEPDYSDQEKIREKRELLPLDGLQ